MSECETEKKDKKEVYLLFYVNISAEGEILKMHSKEFCVTDCIKEINENGEILYKVKIDNFEDFMEIYDIGAVLLHAAATKPAFYENDKGKNDIFNDYVDCNLNSKAGYITIKFCNELNENEAVGKEFIFQAFCFDWD